MGKYYKYVLDKDYSIQLPGVPFYTEAYFYSRDNRLRAIIMGGQLIILKDYAWDGCSPKRRYGDIVLGTWDGFNKRQILADGSVEYAQQMKYPSLVHDVFCQFFDKLPEDIDKAYVDKLFLTMSQEQKFIFSRLYYWGVKYGGPIYTGGRIS